MEKKKISWGQIAAIVLSVGITVGIILLRHQLKQLMAFGYPGLFILALVGNATVLIPAPTYALVFAAGAAYNPFWVGIISAAGASIGELTGYLAGYGGQAIIEDKKMYERLVNIMRKAGLLGIFVLAVIPNPFFDLGGIAAGALKMPVWQFLIAAWAGKTVRFILVAMGGARLFPA
jgi:uncharacterized membrane protein YdjX (TVP38/TMEM64 family)